MKIRISLTQDDEWSDCWLQTEYLGKSNETFRCFIYPTTWSELYRIDGFVEYSWVSKDCPIRIRKFVNQSIQHLKPKQEQNDRTLTKVQNNGSIFKRLFSWYSKTKSRFFNC